MKKKISLGKIAYENAGEKTNSASVTIELKENDRLVIDYDTLNTCHKVPVLSICGAIRNGNNHDYLSLGQNINTLAELLPDNPKMQRIYKIWKEYHLNDMQAGTKMQANAIKKWEKVNKYEYTAACEYLKKIGLYEDRGYRYGSQWLYKPIPEDILKEIEELCKHRN